MPCQFSPPAVAGATLAPPARRARQSVIALLLLGGVCPVPCATLRAQAVAPDAVRVGTLTLDSLFRLVFSRSPRLRAAQAVARAAEARAPGASRPPDPEVQLAFMNYTLPRLTQDPTLGMTQLQVMQMLPIPGKLAASGSAARARAEAGRARAIDVGWQSWSDATMAFYERYRIDGAIGVARESRRFLEDVASVARSMYRIGDGRQADVLRADVEIARMDEELIRMETMREVMTARLAAVVDTAAEVVAVSSQLPPFPDSIASLDALERLALVSRPMLIAGAADVRAAEFDAALARRELWPDLRLGVQYGLRRMDTGVDRMGSLMIGASIPVYAHDRQLRMRDETSAMRQMSEAELQSMRSDTRARLAEVRATLVSTRRLRTLYRTAVLPQAEAATTSTLASYRTGRTDFTAVLDSRMNVNRYRQELLALDATEGRSWAELEMLVGRRLLPSTTSSSAREQNGAPGQGAR